MLLLNVKQQRTQPLLDFLNRAWPQVWPQVVTLVFGFAMKLVVDLQAPAETGAPSEYEVRRQAAERNSHLLVCYQQASWSILLLRMQRIRLGSGHSRSV